MWRLGVFRACGYVRAVLHGGGGVGRAVRVYVAMRTQRVDDRHPRPCPAGKRCELADERLHSVIIAA